MHICVYRQMIDTSTHPNNICNLHLPKKNFKPIGDPTNTIITICSLYNSGKCAFRQQRSLLLQLCFKQLSSGAMFHKSFIGPPIVQTWQSCTWRNRILELRGLQVERTDSQSEEGTPLEEEVWSWEFFTLVSKDWVRINTLLLLGLEPDSEVWKLVFWSSTLKMHWHWNSSEVLHTANMWSWVGMWTVTMNERLFFFVLFCIWGGGGCCL